MESAADWPPSINRVPRRPKVAQFCAAPWHNFTPPLTPEQLIFLGIGPETPSARLIHANQLSNKNCLNGRNRQLGVNMVQRNRPETRPDRPVLRLSAPDFHASHWFVVYMMLTV
jgi:hypothetical protein